jgi:hypothetical protein
MLPREKNGAPVLFALHAGKGQGEAFSPQSRPRAAGPDPSGVKLADLGPILRSTKSECTQRRSTTYSRVSGQRTQRSERKGFGPDRTQPFPSAPASVLLGCRFFAGREDSPRRREIHKTSWSWWWSWPWPE